MDSDTDESMMEEDFVTFLGGEDGNEEDSPEEEEESPTKDNY
jgi:hypothetical protein